MEGWGKQRNETHNSDKTFTEIGGGYQGNEGLVPFSPAVVCVHLSWQHFIMLLSHFQECSGGGSEGWILCCCPPVLRRFNVSVCWRSSFVKAPPSRRDNSYQKQPQATYRSALSSVNHQHRTVRPVSSAGSCRKFESWKFLK